MYPETSLRHCGLDPQSIASKTAMRFRVKRGMTLRGQV